MYRFCLCICILGILSVPSVNPVSAQVFDEGTFTEKQVASKNQAIAMSAIFPGLGQMALGYKIKGLVLFAGELTSFVVSINVNENYRTLKSRHSQTAERYLALRQGARFEEALEMWEDIQDMEDDLDHYHKIRQVIYLSAGIYLYNLIDILFFSSTEENLRKAEGPSGRRFEIAPQQLDDSFGVGLTCRFL